LRPSHRQLRPSHRLRICCRVRPELKVEHEAPFLQCCVTSSASGRGRGLAAESMRHHSFGVWTEFPVPTGKRERTPERNAIGRTHVRASSGGAKAWDPMASSRLSFCRKRAPYQQHSMALTLTQQNPWWKARARQSTLELNSVENAHCTAAATRWFLTLTRQNPW
jgi:hypothetical protein